MEFKNKYQITKINFSEYDEVARLVNSAYRGDTSCLGWTTEAAYLDGQRTDPVLLKKELEDENKIVLCLRTKNSPEIIGTVFLEKFKDDKGWACYLGMLTIKPALQNTGLGKWIMREAESYALSLVINRMTLGVLHPRQELLAWYERRGYLRTGELQDFPYGQDEFGVPKVKDLHFIMFEKTI